MLHGRHTIEAYRASNVIIWMTMAFQGGFLNAASFLTAARFVSHVTGYGTLLGVSLRDQALGDAAVYAAIPICFLLGAMVSGWLIDLPIRLKKPPRYYLSFGLMCLLLLAVLLETLYGIFESFGEPQRTGQAPYLVYALAFICGIQNGTITTVSQAVIRTTHLSGITTDLGIGIIRILNRRRLPDAFSTELRSNLMRVGIIAFFISGSFFGALLFKRYGYFGFCVPIATSGTLAAFMLISSYRKTLRS